MFFLGIKMIFALILIGIMMYGLALGFKYAMKNDKVKKILEMKSEQQRIVVKSRNKLSPKHSIAIIEIDGEEVVVGLSETNISLLNVPLKKKQ